eukprot:7238469-Alexandrium_andersonii.AAC.1
MRPSRSMPISVTGRTSPPLQPSRAAQWGLRTLRGARTRRGRLTATAPSTSLARSPRSASGCRTRRAR